ncbi:MAG: DUF2760 domain-containing protein [Deltaproteobacteria bacterium]|nr:DUF2760 domain-containing protein [Deltaproteobacteria bacterium]
MGIIIAGLLCLAATLSPILPVSWSFIPPEIQADLDLFVPALIVYLMASALKQEGSSTRPVTQVEEDEPPESVEPAAATRLRELEEENQARADKQRQLERALADAKAHLEKSKSFLNGSSREALIDAEVINLLSLLQEKGRFLDFLMDDISTFGDAQIGAGARVVHQGCAAVMREYFELVPVHEGKEGEKVDLGADYKSEHYRLLGKVKDRPPYQGTLLHHGWRTKSVKLPRVTVKNGTAKKEGGIIMPAEVEVA